MVRGVFLIFLLWSCGKGATREQEYSLLNEYVSETYQLIFSPSRSRHLFSGQVQIEGAGLHLKLISHSIKTGYLFLMLSRWSQCPVDNEDKEYLWNLNNDFSSSLTFENGFNLNSERVKKSFDFYLLMKFLKTPKKNYHYLGEEERLSLEFKTLLFYYSPKSLVTRDQLVMIGCAQFHST